MTGRARGAAAAALALALVAVPTACDVDLGERAVSSAGRPTTGTDDPSALEPPAVQEPSEDAPDASSTALAPAGIGLEQEQQQVPPAPRDVAVEVVGPRTVRVTWRPPDLPDVPRTYGDAPRSYRLYRAGPGDSEARLVATTRRPSATDVVPGPGTYEYAVHSIHDPHVEGRLSDPPVPVTVE